MGQPQYAEHDAPPAMGLKGLWAQIAQMGAIGLVMLMFYQDRHESLRVAAEDRQMFRQELKAQRDALDKLTDAVDKLAAQVNRKGQ
jgi:hypothetical protein